MQRSTQERQHAASVRWYESCKWERSRVSVTMLAANVQCAGVGGRLRRSHRGKGGCRFNPARPEPRQSKRPRYSATRARPPGARRRRPPVPVGSPGRGRLWELPWAQRRTRERKGQRQQAGERQGPVRRRPQGSLIWTRSARALSVASWWWWLEQLSVGDQRTNNYYSTSSQLSKSQPLKYGSMHGGHYLIGWKTKACTFHLALAKFFSICAHTFSLMFLSEAAPPEILLYKVRKTDVLLASGFHRPLHTGVVHVITGKPLQG